MPAKGKRNCNRLQIDVSAALVLTHETRKCLLVNIAANGARVRMNKPLGHGESGFFTFHELRRFCRVIWSNGTDCGISFDVPIEQEDMEGMLWIVQNRDFYERFCQDARALDWVEGIER